MREITLASQFEDAFRNAPDNYLSEIPDRGEGEPIFTPEDICTTGCDLDILLRGIFVELGITKEYFHVMFKTYATTVLGLHGTMIGNTKNNLMKALLAGNITIQRFVFTMNELGLTMMDLSIKVKKDASIHTFDLRELQHKYARL